MGVQADPQPNQNAFPSSWEHPGKIPLSGRIRSLVLTPSSRVLTSAGSAEGDDAGAFPQVSGSQPVHQGQEQVPLPPI